MSGKKPDIRLVASNTHDRGIDGLSKTLVAERSRRNGSPDESRTDRSISSSISSDDESAHPTEAENLMRTPSFYKSAQW